MIIDLEIIRSCRSGFPITRDDLDDIFSKLFLDQVIFHRKINGLGIPHKLKGLFQITKKDECTKFCRDLFLDEFDLFLLIHNCNQIGLSHKSKFIQFVPEHLELLAEDKEEIHKGNVQPITKKMRGIYPQRKYLHAHLFQNEDGWYCFYFTYKDIDETKNHWINGPHIHLLNNLFYHQGAEDLWNSLDQRKSKDPGRYHIKFRPFEFSEFTSLGGSSSIKVVYQLSNKYFYDVDYAIDHRTEPTPIALVSTRGSWVTRIYV